MSWDKLWKYQMILPVIIAVLLGISYLITDVEFAVKTIAFLVFCLAIVLIYFQYFAVLCISLVAASAMVVSLQIHNISTPEFSAISAIGFSLVIVVFSIFTARDSELHSYNIRHTIPRWTLSTINLIWAISFFAFVSAILDEDVQTFIGGVALTIAWPLLLMRRNAAT